MRMYQSSTLQIPWPFQDMQGVSHFERGCTNVSLSFSSNWRLVPCVHLISGFLLIRKHLNNFLQSPWVSRTVGQMRTKHCLGVSFPHPASKISTIMNRTYLPEKQTQTVQRLLERLQWDYFVQMLTPTNQCNPFNENSLMTHQGSRMENIFLPAP